MPLAVQDGGDSAVEPCTAAGQESDIINSSGVFLTEKEARMMGECFQYGFVCQLQFWRCCHCFVQYLLSVISCTTEDNHHC